ncbi:uncharacterized protein IUM83_11346 [Phytophthora cinnamomi]|uniref:uncharacterized protein n=1 Tax=Phytophthora cinnamomi TaxID=4785 RepID=UPI0035598C18|nr:hypothetical protein IUM83_11346 [Phytophthora cinnamomi]
MKTYATLAASALVLAVTMDSTMAMKAYLKDLPNGDLFTMAVAHPDSNSSKFTKFATAFSAVDHTWTAAFCKETFPGASMTNGEAFGDPCCTWKKGGKPDFTVTAFTTTPGKATTCAAGGGSGKTGTGSASTLSTGSGAETPSTEQGSGAETPSTEQGSLGAETPSTEEGSSAETPSTEQGSGGETPSAETPSAETPSTGGGGWTPPATGGGCAAKGARKFRH